MLNHPVSLNEHKSSVVELLENNGSFSNIQTQNLDSVEKLNIQAQLRVRYKYLDDPSSMIFESMIRVTAEYRHNPENLSMSDKYQMDSLFKGISESKRDFFEQKALQTLNNSGVYRLGMVCITPP